MLRQIIKIIRISRKSLLLQIMQNDVNNVMCGFAYVVSSRFNVVLSIEY